MTQTDPGAPSSSQRRTAIAVLFVMPLFFSSNIIFGRAVTHDVEPFTLAFLRWSLTALILLPFGFAAVRRQFQTVLGLGRTLALLGFLGMWICGALVYLALDYTTATNGTLIYTSSPVLIILIEWLRGRAVSWRESTGVFVALCGVVVIIVKGSLDILLSLSFNIGDLIFVFCAASWAIYSVLLKANRLVPLQTLPLFMLIAASGAILLLPFALTEIIWLGAFPTSASAWTNIAGIVVFASLLAFSAFQFGVKVIGPSLTGVFLYLLPVYGVGLAVLFLGEQLAIYHLWGVLLVLSGVMLATWPKRR